MPRVHLFELMDLEGFPTRLRDLMRDQLRAAETMFPIFDAIVPMLAQAIEQSGERRFVDLCSGTGGPARRLAALLRDTGQADGVVLTDLFPVDGEQSDSVVCHPTAVDATKVPDELRGARTIFNAFHHFPEDLARSILADAAAAQRPILVVETLSRSWRGFVVAVGIALLSPILVWVLRPFELDRILLNTVLPILIPLLIWDGVVSCLRIYSPEELRALTDGLDDDGYRWEIGTTRTGVLTELHWLRGIPR